jgi:hypothetical protein
VGRVTAAQFAAVCLRALLDKNDSDALVKGLALVEPWQRAELRRVLDLADSLTGAEPKEKRVSVLSEVEQTAEKIFHEVEGKVEEFDGQALSVARQAIAVAVEAEGQAVQVTENYKNQLVALAEQYGPQLAELGEQLFTDIKTLFGVE